MKSRLYYYPTNLSVPLIDRVKHLRRALTIHSYIYYTLDTNIITDHQWQKLANELSYIQTEYPELQIVNLWDSEFKDWNGSTGIHLSKEPYVVRKANQLLNYATRNLTTKNTT